MTDILTNLTAVLRTTPTRFTALADTFPDDLLRRKPLQGEWSALEVLVHLIDMETFVFPTRVKALLASENFPAFFPDDEGSALDESVSAHDLAAQFAALREENLKLVATITPADLANTATHAELGVVSLENLLNEWGGHDLMHLVQANQALMQPFIDDCGAWLPYFEEHRAKTDYGEGKTEL